MRPLNSERRQNYFKFLGPWLDHPDFKVQVKNSRHLFVSWNENIMKTTFNLVFGIRRSMAIFSK